MRTAETLSLLSNVPTGTVGGGLRFSQWILHVITYSADSGHPYTRDEPVFVRYDEQNLSCSNRVRTQIDFAVLLIVIVIVVVFVLVVAAVRVMVFVFGAAVVAVVVLFRVVTIEGSSAAQFRALLYFVADPVTVKACVSFQKLCLGRRGKAAYNLLRLIML